MKTAAAVNLRMSYMGRRKLNKNNDNKKRSGSLGKKIILAAVIIASSLAVLDIIVANVFVNIALVDHVDADSEIAPESIVDAEAKKKIDENRKKSDAETEIWYKTAGAENVSVTSEDGLKLYGDLFVNDETSHNWSICLHGYAGDRAQLRCAAKFYYEKGYNVIAPDLRTHGESEGNYRGMGWLERRDMIKWIDMITARDPEAKIVLHGGSMGAATVMMTIGEDDIPPNVVAAIEDCGYTSVWDVFSDEMKNFFHLPDFPVLHTASVFSGLRAGYNFWEASSLEQIKKTRIPVLFIHGSADNFVDTRMVYELYNACPTEKKIYVAEGAGHGESYYLDMERYREEVETFLEGKM